MVVILSTPGEECVKTIFCGICIRFKLYGIGIFIGKKDLIIFPVTWYLCL